MKTELEGPKHWPSVEVAGRDLRGDPSEAGRNPETESVGSDWVTGWIVQEICGRSWGDLEPGFSEHSYGFRPGRSTHDAVRAAREYVVRGGRDWVVDLDIEKFFDRVHHDIMMRRIGAVIREGAETDWPVPAQRGSGGRRGGGSPGGDRKADRSPRCWRTSTWTRWTKNLERRGYCFVRYADDCNVYVGGATAADRVVRNLPQWIAKHLRLKVNARKTGVGRPWERKFLGFRITRKGQIEVAPEKPEAAEVTGAPTLGRPRQNLSSLGLRDQWRQHIRGWWGYYRLAEWRRPVWRLEGWIRRHMRKCFWLRWHGWRGRLRRLRSLGVREPLLRVAHSSRGSWRIARHSALHTALSNRRLRRYGFLIPSDLG